MNIYELPSPCILLDMDVLERNIEKYQAMAAGSGKQLWPMVKTHKSTELAKMQQAAGAEGFLCGTLDECEALCRAGLSPLMYAYPPAGKASIERVLSLCTRCDFTIRLDSLEGARAINALAEKAGVLVKYCLIIDCGLHRFGITPKEALEFLRSISSLDNLRYVGISSHSGQVYAARNQHEVPIYALQERQAISEAVALLTGAGFEPRLVSTGSTPTFSHCLADGNIGILHPGNYVFNDCIQISNGSCTEEDCALTVLATVISQPTPELLICDAGAKCLGLDQGAHGNSSIVGHGRVMGHPELSVVGLSEEVGKLHIHGECALGPGDSIRIIPNHACSSANLTNYFVCHRGNEVCSVMEVDIRGNSKIPLLK